MRSLINERPDRLALENILLLNLTYLWACFCKLAFRVSVVVIVYWSKSETRYFWLSSECWMSRERLSRERERDWITLFVYTRYFDFRFRVTRRSSERERWVDEDKVIACSRMSCLVHSCETEWSIEWWQSSVSRVCSFSNRSSEAVCLTNRCRFRLFPAARERERSRLTGQIVVEQGDSTISSIHDGCPHCNDRCLWKRIFNEVCFPFDKLSRRIESVSE
jgi:hypothetical protein